MHSIGYRATFAFLFLGILCFGIALPAFGQGTIQVMSMNGGSVAPVSVAGQILDVTPQSAVMLGNVPTSSWTYGCSATSAGMMFGYYDRLGYSNMYAGPANGGLAPLSDLGNACSLIATRNGLDGRTAPGHVDDYWIGTNSAGPDPWVGVRSEHVWGDCVADYMGTNQWKWDFIGGDGVNDFNVDGGTALFSYGSSWGGRLYDYIPDASAGMPQTELCHGMRLFAESRGYEVLENYTQSIDTIVTGGFTFNDYMSEINQGYPVMIQVTDHTMVGVGYDASLNRVYLHDTWGDYTSWMTWGGSYSGLTQQAVTVIHLAPVPEPSSMMLLSLGAIGAVGLAFVFWRQQ
jgi:hypothetical protein